MPRRGRITKRDVLPDPLYNSKLVTKLINNVMYDGKKGVAQTIVYDAFSIIADKTGENALEVFQAALDNIKPELEVKARRVGGSTYQVPMDVRPDRKQTLALRWLISYGGASRRRDPGRQEQHGRSLQEEGRNPSYGGGEQGVRTLQVLIGGQLPLIGQFKTKE